MIFSSKIFSKFLKKVTTSKTTPLKNSSLLFASIALCTLPTPSLADHYPSPTEQMVPLVLSCQTPGMVALTFDDGPSENFDSVLSTLDDYNAKATFFLLGKKLEKQIHIDRALQAIAAGHQIENHSWDHPDFLTLSEAEITEQVDKTNEILWNSIGVIPRFVRPPYGRIDIPQAMPIWNLGYGVALWNLDPRDYDSSLFWGPQQVLDRIVDALNNSSASTDSFVILLHDHSDTSATRLGDIILAVRQNGYQLATLNDCTENKGHPAQ